MRHRFVHLANAAISISLLFFCTSSHASDKVFKTRYADIHYSEDKDLSDFIFRLGGQRLDPITDSGLVTNRFDRLVDRVITILDMRPKAFHIDVFLKRGALSGPNEIAYHDSKKRSITISVDTATDGVISHEIAHAVINQSYPIQLPDKVQEILTQYVDRYLWNEY